MSRIITVDVFDQASIAKAVKDVQGYAEWVQQKAVELRKRVADLIAAQAQPIFDSAVADDLFTEGAVLGNVQVTVQDNGNVTLVIASGEDAVFMEFGAGVYHNGPVGSSPNPLGAGLGFTIGSYSQSVPEKEVWGFYGDDGELHLTHGTPASMPLYNAMKSVLNDIVQIAKGVFSP